MIYSIWKLLLLRLMLLWPISQYHQEEKDQTAHRVGPLHKGRVLCCEPKVFCCVSVLYSSSEGTSPWLRVSISWFINSEAAWLDGFSCLEQKRLQRYPSSVEVLGSGGTKHTCCKNPLWFPLYFACVRTAEQELFSFLHPL